jgi:hypothetical protein
VSTPKLTPWFPGHIKPVRPGVYETDNQGGRGKCFQHWDGKRWGYACTTAKRAAVYNEPDYKSAWQDDKWRGLAEEPK